MKQLRWQILIVVLALIAIGILLLIEQPEVVQPVQNPQIEPATGGIYTEAIVGSLHRLNPLLDYNNQPDRDINRLVFSGLVHFDDRGLPQADLAESWGISQDGKDYYVSLRSDAQWHDGEPVTSQDIVFTIDLVRSPDFPGPEDLRTFWEQVEVLAIDERTLQFRLPEPLAPFLDYLNLGILPSHLLNSVAAADLPNDRFNLAPVGSGPFRFERLLTKDGKIQGVVLTANKNYYGEKPFLEQVIFQYYPDARTALTAYQDGEVSGINQITGEILAEALREPKLNIYTSRMPQLTLIYLNLNDPSLPFFQDAQLRTALFKGLNRQKMVDEVLRGQAILADSPILPGSWAYYENNEPVAFDPISAVASLKSAGYNIPAEGGNVRAKDGVRFSFEMAYPDDAHHTAIFEIIRENWEELGVEVKPKPVQYAALLSEYLEPRAFQAVLVELDFSRTPDPDPYPLWDQAQITGGQNYSGWNDRKASEYLETARVSTDLSERIKAYKNFQVRFIQELPALPLYYQVYSYGVDEQILGVGMGPLYDPSDRLAGISRWYILAQRAAATVETPAVTP